MSDPATEGAPAGAPSAKERAVAAQVFGDRLPMAERYAALLADTGSSHGLIGPREVPRLWERHLLNCAVLQEGVPHGATVIDVGSGAGLPGLVLAIARPDLTVTLVEPMLRRTTWLESTVADLGLDDVTVHRARAEQCWGELRAPVVTARAVARLAELGRWCLPLVEGGGVLLALKGSSAAEELERDRADLRAQGAAEESIEIYGQDLLTEPTTVVRIAVDEVVAPAPASPGAGSARRAKRRGGTGSARRRRR